jgi:hypothetical protein
VFDVLNVVKAVAVLPTEFTGARGLMSPGTHLLYASTQRLTSGAVNPARRPGPLGSRDLVRWRSSHWCDVKLLLQLSHLKRLVIPMIRQSSNDVQFETRIAPA